MSEEIETTDDSDGIKNLRNQYEALKKELENSNKELASFRQQKRSGDVASILKAKGLEEAKAAKAASLYGGEDVSEDAVGKWLEDYGDVFGVAANTSEQDQNTLNAERVTSASFGTQPTAGASTDGKIVGDISQMQHLMETLPYEKLQELGWMPAANVL